MKEINYSPDLWAKDKDGILRNEQIAFAMDKAEKNGIKQLRQEGNTMRFTTYGARKIQGGYNSTEYIFRPATWAVRKYDVRTNRNETKVYAY